MSVRVTSDALKGSLAAGPLGPVHSQGRERQGSGTRLLTHTLPAMELGQQPPVWRLYAVPGPRALRPTLQFSGCAGTSPTMEPRPGRRELLWGSVRDLAWEDQESGRVRESPALPPGPDECRAQRRGEVGNQPSSATHHLEAWEHSLTLSEFQFPQQNEKNRAPWAAIQNTMERAASTTGICSSQLWRLVLALWDPGESSVSAVQTPASRCAFTWQMGRALRCLL